MSVGFHRNRAGGLTPKILFGLAVCAVMAGMFAAQGTVMTPPETRRKLELTSSAFKEGEPIPRRFTCDGKNISPPLAWQGTPQGTQSFVLIVDDPDSPTGIWTHWTLYDLPPETSELAEDFVKSPAAMGSAKEGANSFKHPGYGGPCPPAGKPHRYFFKLYALDVMPHLPAGASRQEVEAAMTKHVLAIGQLMGTYQRK